LRDSKSLDLDKSPVQSGANPSIADIIHAQAGSPSVFTGNLTPGMQTPKELVSTPGASIPPSSAGSNGTGLANLPEVPGGNPYDREPNPFGEFSSVTRDFGEH